MTFFAVYPKDFAVISDDLFYWKTSLSSLNNFLFGHPLWKCRSLWKCRPGRLAPSVRHCFRRIVADHQISTVLFLCGKITLPYVSLQVLFFSKPPIIYSPLKVSSFTHHYSDHLDLCCLFSNIITDWNNFLFLTIASKDAVFRDLSMLFDSKNSDIALNA